jgi:hypothetical protein
MHQQFCLVYNRSEAQFQSDGRRMKFFDKIESCFPIKMISLAMILEICSHHAQSNPGRELSSAFLKG